MGLQSLITKFTNKSSGNKGDDKSADNGAMLSPPAAEMQDSSSSSEDTASDGSLNKREQWANKMDFLLACVGFSVGLGNVWRFPYLCYKNGGGAFLFPYFLCVVIGGIPMFFLEVALGQFMSVGGIGAWYRLCPLFQGIGVASCIIVALLNIYYNVILSWAFYYLFSSFTTTLPWSHCNNEWNSQNCVISFNRGKTKNMTGVLMNSSYLYSAARNVSSFDHENVTGSFVSLNSTHVDPVIEFWEKKVLQISDGIENVGGLKWDLTLCLLLAWVVIYLCIWKGIKSSGKVMYFTATSPYILMAILLIRGVTLPGAIDGIKYYLVPDWERLKDPQVWVEAGTQIFFSYSISLGALTALGSYNKFNHNAWRDSVAFACTNSGTSFFSGFVIFSVLGFMANEQGVSVAEVAESGPGLAFIAYPKAVAQMPCSPLWAILFFTMIILLGLDSQFVGVEGFVTAIVDEYAHYLRKGYRRQVFIGLVCFFSFLVGLSMVTNGGMYVFQLFDYYSGSRIILLVAFFECIALAYCYGVTRFYDNLEMMLGYSISPYMKVSWSITTPLFTLVMFALCLYSYSDLTYNRTYSYPTWAIAIGWGLACSSVMMIPLFAVGRLLTTPGTLRQRITILLRPRLYAHQLRLEDSPKDLIDYDPKVSHTGTKSVPIATGLISKAEKEATPLVCIVNTSPLEDCTKDELIKA